MLAGEPLQGQYVDRSAYSHARLKYCYEVYSHLNQQFLRDVDSEYLNRRFHGMRVFGVDGTLIGLPNEEALISKFGVWGARNGDSTPRARVSAFFDCLNLVSHDHQIEPRSIGEREMAYRHMINTDLSSNDVTTFDRGYAAHWLFQMIMDKGTHFCARMPTSWQEVKDFLNSDAQDLIVEFAPSHPAKKSCQEHGLQARSLCVRLIKVVLPTGTTEVLATSIMNSGWTENTFKELYNLRWQTEENYKVIKCRIRVEKFIGKSVLAVRQEFHARMFMLNITSVIRHEADRLAQAQHDRSNRKNKSKTPFKTNFKQALSRVHRAGVLLFFRDLRETLQRLVEQMTENLTKIIPGRKSPRMKKNTRGYHQTYAGI